MEQITALQLLFSILILFGKATSSSMVEERRTYIIHMDKSSMPVPFTTHHHWYTSTLASLDGIAPTHLYTYNHVMNGFSAVLTESQLEQLEKIPGHVASHPERFGQLHTTHTTNFLGLKKFAGLWPKGGFGDDMIIGILDTGIWPESESFKDHGMPPVPERWRGICEKGIDFNSSYCNKKLIGARSFSKGLKQLGIKISPRDDYDSPRDYFGHGTHTSSTATGSRVANANYFGYAEGTAVGVAPLARLAMYKVLFLNDTYESASSDTLAGIDQAIEDGVDLMSMSLGFIETPYWENPISLGAFAALEKGIFVSCSAGNRGPHAYTILNGAPWITTVGAGTIDRGFAASVTLGEGFATVEGKSVYPENLLVFGVPLYYGHGNTTKETCSSLDPKDIAGKIVAISPSDGEKVEEYLAKTKQPTVDIKFQVTNLGTKPAPQVAYFSSRGPARQSPWILKPDILAPGVEILAAWVPNRGFTPIGNDYLLTDFEIVSGTSMSSPHIVGIAALLKSAHRDWSSAAIRSAMMTTADIVDNSNGRFIDMTTGTSGTPLDFGAGHVNPNKALDPGLVYDIDVENYINFICALNYTQNQITAITRRSNYTCENANLDLNYPSFIVILNNTNTTSYNFKRILTNVADLKSVYRAVIQAPSGMKVVVEPMTISFGSKYSKANFSLSVEIDLGQFVVESDYIGNYGYLSWYEVNGKHSASSDTLAGIDQAIDDDVDVISLSLGFVFDPFFQNPISLGTFGAVEKGIFVACSAANSGPDAYSIMNGLRQWAQGPLIETMPLW
ncbi:hypothetical protein Sjap_017284 [Stephania japonica]|uniref:Uncharacterized protein n=1 Tax=Stephania japonica TaxID=461633 RepID=A0AAP0NJQ8_9MAGN